MSRERKILYVDMDGVLVDFQTDWIEYQKMKN